MQIEPITTLLVDPQRAARISVPAFDSLTEDGRRTLREGEPLTWLHAMQSPREHGSLDAALVASASAVRRLLDQGAFRTRTRPGLYLYRLSEGGWSQTGLVADLPVEQFHNGTVRPHERTRPEQVRQLRRHLEVVGVSSSPLAVAYRSTPRIADLVRRVVDGDPVLVFDSSDGLHQQVWEVPEGLNTSFISALATVATGYITDGHHRARAAVDYARGPGPSVDGQPRADRVLTVLFPEDNLRIVEFNRVVHEVPDADGLRHILANWHCRPISRDQVRPAPGTIGVWLDAGWRIADLPADPTLRPPESLDPTVLQDRLLGPVMGIHDPASDPRLSYVPGSVGLADLEVRAAGGAAFVLAPLTFGDITTVSDAGRFMPPKSTYFEPKVRSGIFLVRR